MQNLATEALWLHPYAAPVYFYFIVSWRKRATAYFMGVQVRVEEDKLETTQVAAHNLSAMLMFPKGHGEIDFLCGAVMSSIRDARSWQPMHLGISVAVPFTDTGFFVFICLCLTLHISISLLSVPSLSLSLKHTPSSHFLSVCVV